MNRRRRPFMDLPDGWDGGRRHDHKLNEQFLNDPKTHHPVFSVGATKLKSDYVRKDTHLSRFLIRCNPRWKRGRQGIGSCVGWGAELVCTILNAKRCVKQRKIKEFVEASTEGCYGGSRCEAQDRSFAGWRDGSYGAAAAAFVRDYGVPWRKDYSTITGNPEHDLRVYSVRKEKDWGAYGCGGRNDGGDLDRVVGDSPVLNVSLIGGFEDAAASIAGALCPVTIASNYGCSMSRDKYGQCYWDRSWGHQMCVLDVRFGSHPAVRIFQSWGPDSCDGPSGDEYTDLPEEWENGTPEVILGCSWWCPADEFDKICQQDDSWAYGDLPDWKVDRFTWSNLFG